MNRSSQINEVLMEWNPLSVVGPALSDEYVGLIPQILRQNNKLDLEIFLKQIMSEKYGVDFKESEVERKLEFQSIIKRIENILWQ